jgi:hypothetical protein
MHVVVVVERVEKIHDLLAFYGNASRQNLLYSSCVPIHVQMNISPSNHAMAR